MDPTHILIRGVNWLGDAVMTTPALARLRAALPRCRITLLTPEGLADLWLHHPSLDAVVPIQPGESPMQLGRRLRSEGFDCALILPNSPRSALEMWAARIPRRIGLRRPWRDFLLTERVPPRQGETPMRKRGEKDIRRRIAGSGTVTPTTYLPGAHHVHHYLHLASRLGAVPEPLAPKVVVSEEEIASFRQAWIPAAAARTQWLLIHPGAAYGPAKRWPEERFAEAALAWHAETGCGCMIIGGPLEAELAGTLAQGLAAQGVDPILNLAGRTRLRELCVALAVARVVLTNDSGPMHLAAALDTPVVAIFGSTAPELTGPGHPEDPAPHQLLRQATPCAPCFRRECPIDRRCLTRVTVAQVVEAMRTAWARARSR